MKINRGSVLSKEYFISYLNLVMKSRDYDLSAATDYVINHFFHGDICKYGERTYQNFLSSVEYIKKSS